MQTQRGDGEKDGAPAQEVFLHCCTTAVLRAGAAAFVLVEKLQRASKEEFNSWLRAGDHSKSFHTSQ